MILHVISQYIVKPHTISI